MLMEEMIGMERELRRRFELEVPKVRKKYKKELSARKILSQ